MIPSLYTRKDSTLWRAITSTALQCSRLAISTHLVCHHSVRACDLIVADIVDHMGFTVPLAEAKYNGLLRSLGMTADRTRTHSACIHGASGFAMNGHTEIVPKNSARFLYFLNVVAVCNRRWGTPVYGYEYVYRLHTMSALTRISARLTLTQSGRHKPAALLAAGHFLQVRSAALRDELWRRGAQLLRDRPQVCRDGCVPSHSKCTR